MCTNNKVKVGFIDDDKYALDIISSSIQRILTDNGFQVEMKTVCDPETFSPEDFGEMNLFFFDIELGNKDGIKMAEAYHKKYPNCDLAFISNREERVFDSLVVSPLGFVRKKNFLNDIRVVVTNFIEKRHRVEEPDLISLTVKGNIMTFDIDDIVMIETDGRYQKIHLLSKEEPIVVSLTMSKFEAKLYDKGFVQSHKAYLINCKYIREVRADDVLMKNGKTAYLSRRKAAEVKEKYLDYLKSEDTLVF